MATPTWPSRRHPAHPAPLVIGNRPVVVYATVCTEARAEILACDEVHQVLREVWRQTRSWLVGYYMIMPDHVHFFCAPREWPTESVKDWAAYWKGQTARRMEALRGRWQSDCWDTQLRTADQYRAKLEYVSMNPVRQRLAARSEDWSYQGRLADLIWINE